MPWEEWIENFEDYVEARGGVDKWPDARKVALLRRCLGQEGQAVYRTIKDQAAEGDTEFEKAKSRLGKRFAKKKKDWLRQNWNSPVGSNNPASRSEIS